MRHDRWWRWRLRTTWRHDRRRGGERASCARGDGNGGGSDLHRMADAGSRGASGGGLHHRRRRAAARRHRWPGAGERGLGALRAAGPRGIPRARRLCAPCAGCRRDDRPVARPARPLPAAEGGGAGGGLHPRRGAGVLVGERHAGRPAGDRGDPRHRRLGDPLPADLAGDHPGGARAELAAPAAGAAYRRADRAGLRAGASDAVRGGPELPAGRGRHRRSCGGSI